MSAAWRRGLAIADAEPSRFLTLTLVGDDWQTVRLRMKRLGHNVRDQVGAFDWVWTVEPNPKGTGHHVHAWATGRFVPFAELRDLAVREGMGRMVRIERWDSHQGAEVYGFKGVGYGLKGAEATAAAASYLANNGQRLSHQSRGFFAGGVRAAERRGVERSRAAGEVRDWMVVSVAELAGATAPAPRVGCPVV